jgi:hypothetical protein
METIIGSAQSEIDRVSILRKPIDSPLTRETGKSFTDAINIIKSSNKPLKMGNGRAISTVDHTEILTAGTSFKLNFPMLRLYCSVFTCEYIFYF